MFLCFIHLRERIITCFGSLAIIFYDALLQISFLIKPVDDAFILELMHVKLQYKYCPLKHVFVSLESIFSGEI